MKTILSLLLLFSSLTCTSQNKDYIIKHSGDTLWGYIKLKSKAFIISGTNNVVINANEVKKIHSSHYSGSTVVHCNLQLYTDNLLELEKDWVNLSSKDTVLILDEVYTTEKMNLYFGTDSKRTPYYFYKTALDTVPVQLVVRYHIAGGVNTNNTTILGGVGRTHIEESKGYVNQLRAIMGECNKISEVMWEMLSYRIYSFKQLIKKYNKCK